MAGATILTPEQLAETNSELRPCIEFALGDETPAGISKRRAENSSTRSMQWLRTYLDSRCSIPAPTGKPVKGAPTEEVPAATSTGNQAPTGSQVAGTCDAGGAGQAATQEGVEGSPMHELHDAQKHEEPTAPVVKRARVGQAAGSGTPAEAMEPCIGESSRAPSRAASSAQASTMHAGVATSAADEAEGVGEAAAGGESEGAGAGALQQRHDLEGGAQRGGGASPGSNRSRHGKDQWGGTSEARLKARAGLQDGEVPGGGWVVGTVCGHAVPHRGRSVAQMIAEFDRELAGYYVAGRGLGESADEWCEIVATVKLDLPPQKPLFVCGVGGPRDIIANVKMGFDVLESRYTEDATSSGRALVFSWGAQEEQAHPATSASAASGHGQHPSGAPGHQVVQDAAPLEQLAAEEGSVWLELQAAKYKLDSRPLLPGCECPTCMKHTRAYLHHLLDAKEMLGWMLLEVHNVHHMLLYMAAVRAAIHSSTLSALEASLPQNDTVPPPAATKSSTALSQAAPGAVASDVSFEQPPE